MLERIYTQNSRIGTSLLRFNQACNSLDPERRSSPGCHFDTVWRGYDANSFAEPNEPWRNLRATTVVRDKYRQQYTLVRD